VQRVDAVSVAGSSVSDDSGILSLQIGEIVRLEFQREDGWWYGTSSTSHYGGWFPSASVDFLPGFKLGVSRCGRCFVVNPRFTKQLPGISTAATTTKLGPLHQYETNGISSSSTAVAVPSFPQRSANATAFSANTPKSVTIVSLKPLSSPMKIKSFYGPHCQNLEILSLSPLLLKLEGFLDGPTCRSLISAAYQRGFSAEESGCHGDDDNEGEHDGHHHEPPFRNAEQQRNNTTCTHDQDKSTQEGEDPDNIPVQSRSGAGRTSTACWLRKYDYDTSQTTTEAPQMIAYEDRAAFVDTETKISNLSGFPVSHQEPLQVVRYFPGQEFVPHMDWIDDYTNEPYGGRVITVLIYLQAPKEGGSTTFPKLDKDVPPMQGTALFWYNCHPTDNARTSAIVDDRMLHAGESVLSGEKIVAVTWVHPFDATELRER
jgi:hypothetical protein